MRKNISNPLKQLDNKKEHMYNKSLKKNSRKHKHSEPFCCNLTYLSHRGAVFLNRSRIFDKFYHSKLVITACETIH